MDDLNAKSLRELCDEYVWCMLDSRWGSTPIREERREEIHSAMAKILGIEIWDGIFGIFHRLEELGFPAGVEPDLEDWSGICLRVGERAYNILLEYLGLDNLDQDGY